MSVRSVLVYSVEEISGDGLIKLPFIAGVRAAFPDARFSWCAASGSSVYDGWLKPAVEGVIDELILNAPVGEGRLDFLSPRAPFGGRTFDLVIDTQRNLARSLAVRRAAKGAFIASTAYFILSNRKPSEPWPEAMVDQLALLLRLAGGANATPRPLPLVNADARAAAFALLPEGPTYVGFAPGAGGPERRWPIERYIELARRQHERGRVPVFFLGPGERDYLTPIRAEAPFALLPGEDRTDLYPDVSGPFLTIALASRLAAGIAADAGPGHMLAAGGAPLVSLFRETRKAKKFRPAAPRVEALVAEDFGDKDIALITVEAADAALERLLVSTTLLPLIPASAGMSGVEAIVP
jgi:ADP-heptose:LPS heptosyltransferase